MTQAIPEGFNTITPHIIVNGAAAAIEFYKKAFGAVEVCRLPMPGSDKLMHAQVRIGNSPLMLADIMQCPQSGESSKSPLEMGGSPVVLHLYVENVDEAFKKAIVAGATEEMPPADMFWGDRYGKVKDPFGHEWSIATKIKDLSPAEMEKAMQECFKEMQPAG
jgi:PhnB protein